MSAPRDTLQIILDYDYAALGVLVGTPPGVDYNIGLVTLTRKPATLEQVDPSKMPWLLQTDGDGDFEYEPSSSVNEGSDLIYLGYVRPDAVRFPGKTAPDIRRGLMCDIEYILDHAGQRGVEVFDRSRRKQVFDDANGEWSLFVITESVRYRRTI
jgi:hypothetical protein